MKNVVITAVVTAVLVAVVVGGPIIYHANEVLGVRDAEIGQLEAEIIGYQNGAALVKKRIKLFTDRWNAQVKRLSDEKAVLKSEIAEWEACAAKRNAEPNLPDSNKLDDIWEVLEAHSAALVPEPTLAVPAVEPNFTDLVQTSLKGVVHLQAPSWQGSGFVVGPRLIATARHCVEGVDSFVLTTHDGHQVRATRAISDKEHDVAFIWVDDLECIAEERGSQEHDVELQSLTLGPIADCVLGQSVYVIGSPYGKKHFNALTMGVMSMTTMDVENYGIGKRYGWASLFMADAATWGGSSGCPVFTMDGIVRGVLVGGHGREENTSYCVPIDIILSKLETVKLKFALDEFEREEISEVNEEWYNYSNDTEYYD